MRIQKPEIEGFCIGKETTEQLKAAELRALKRLWRIPISRPTKCRGRNLARLSAQAQIESLHKRTSTERYSRKSADGKTDIWWYRVDLSPCGGYGYPS